MDVQENVAIFASPVIYVQEEGVLGADVAPSQAEAMEAAMEAAILRIRQARGSAIQNGVPQLVAAQRTGGAR